MDFIYRIKRKIFLRSFFFFSVLLSLSSYSFGQSEFKNADNNSKGIKDELFANDSILEISIHGNLRSLLNERSGSKKKFPVDLTYNSGDGIMSLSITASTRGHFRLQKENCYYPPLLLRFSKKTNDRKSLFINQKKLKLVMPCEDDDYLIGEWLAYKIYNLVTPLSFRARLVKVTLIESKNNKSAKPFYGILIEEESQLAERNNLNLSEAKLRPQQMDTEMFLKMAVFQYLIGNTDWSIEFLQNIKLLTTNPEARPIPVPYDFDHAGIVGATYALPAEELRMASIKERRYRGYCVNDLKIFESILDFYKGLKKEIYALYSSCDLLSEKYKKNTIKFLDDFFERIDNDKAWQKDFAYPCDKNGTGNVVIKGLKED